MKDINNQKYNQVQKNEEFNNNNETNNMNNLDNSDVRDKLKKFNIGKKSKYKNISLRGAVGSRNSNNKVFKQKLYSGNDKIIDVDNQPLNLIKANASIKLNKANLNTRKRHSLNPDSVLVLERFINKFNDFGNQKDFISPESIIEFKNSINHDSTPRRNNEKNSISKRISKVINGILIFIILIELIDCIKFSNFIWYQSYIFYTFINYFFY